VLRPSAQKAGTHLIAEAAKVRINTITAVIAVGVIAIAMVGLCLYFGT
jgi:hypothetical protein